MREQIDALHAQARKLPPAEQLALVDDIFATLDEPDAILDQLWAKEVEARLAAYRRGELKTVGLESVLAKYR